MLDALTLIKNQMTQFTAAGGKADQLVPSMERLRKIADHGYTFDASPPEGLKRHAAALAEMMLGTTTDAVQCVSLSREFNPIMLVTMPGTRLVDDLASRYGNVGLLNNAVRTALWNEFGRSVNRSFTAALTAATIEWPVDNLLWHHDWSMGLSFPEVAFQCLWNLFVLEVRLTMNGNDDALRAAEKVSDLLAMLCDGFFIHGRDSGLPCTLLAFTA